MLLQKVSGQSWNPLGTDGLSGGDEDGYALCGTNSGVLYVGGQFTEVNGATSVNNLATWTPSACPCSTPYTGGTWGTIGSGVTSGTANGAGGTGVYALAYNSTAGVLYVGGNFTEVNGVTGFNNLAQYTTAHGWQNVGGGVAQSAGDVGNLLIGDESGGGVQVQALAVDANGNLYVGGYFNTVDGVVTAANNIAEFSPSGSANSGSSTGTWSTLGGGITGSQSNAADARLSLGAGTYTANATVFAITIDNSGNVYVGGQFTTAGGTGGFNNIAKWNGSWNKLGTGITVYGDGGAGSGPLMYAWVPAVLALVYSGSNIYAGGNFTTAGGTAGFGNLAEWNGSSWSSLGSGVGTASNDAGEIMALYYYNNNLYIGGDFWKVIGGATARGVASWNGSAYSAMPSASSGFKQVYDDVFALSAVPGVGDGGYGILYAGGWMTKSDANVTMDGVAQWAGASTVLPIQLLEFNAIYNEGHENVNLNWETATELNNKKFTVEKSIDGISWEFVASVPGAGNSTTTINYNATDESPYSGVSYYRLKQTDYDGQYTYSDISLIDINASFNKLSVIPNPAKNNAVITFGASEIGNNALVSLYDCTGRLIYTTNLTTINGINTLMLDVSNYSNGMYFVTVAIPQKQYTAKIMVGR